MPLWRLKMSLIANQKESATQFDWEKLQDQLSDEDLAEISLQKVAVNLAALMAFEGKTRSEMAQLLNVSKANITRLLNKTNIETKSIFSFAKALGYDFEIVFKKQDKPACGQPWNRAEKLLIQVNAEDVSSLYQHRLIHHEVYVQKMTVSHEIKKDKKSVGKNAEKSFKSSKQFMVREIA